MRLDTYYKTSSKTRVNAIKRIASKERANLTGYGVMDNYKVVTDTFHAIAIIENNIPLEFKENFPDLHHAFSFNEENYHTTTIDLNDVMSHYKMYKNDLDNPYKIENVCVNVNYLKNINNEYLKLFNEIAYTYLKLDNIKIESIVRCAINNMDKILNDDNTFNLKSESCWYE